MPDLRGDVRAERVQKRRADQDSKRRQGANVAAPPESEWSAERGTVPSAKCTGVCYTNPKVRYHPGFYLKDGGFWKARFPEDESKIRKTRFKTSKLQIMQKFVKTNLLF